MRSDLKEMIVRIPVAQRGFDTEGSWLHPSGPDELPTIEAVRMLGVNISEIAGFTAAQVAAGAEFEDQSDVGALQRVCDEIGDALDVLRRAVEDLRRSTASNGN